MKTTTAFTKKSIMNRHALSYFAAATMLFNTACTVTPGNGQTQQNIPSAFGINNVAPTATGKKQIKIALLLDTSNSMDGLIDQAKSTLWKFVNALSTTSYQNEKPELQIALYEYGNSGIAARDGFIKQVSLFTGDLDLISQLLFSLTTNGGDEFCGQVIHTSLNQLEWQGNTEDLRLIFIAGNEPFTQGKLNFKSACEIAKAKDVLVNTIFCGPFDEGIAGQWKSGADLTGGNYMSIEQDRKTVYIESPFDIEIEKLNVSLNATYIYYGKDGSHKKENQSAQDVNSELYGKANKTERVLSKTSSFYSNSSWDLVDAYNQKDFDISKMKETDWPIELKGKTIVERQVFILQKNNEREVIKKQINEYSIKRKEFIATMPSENSATNSLDEAMLKAITDQAKYKGFTIQ